MKNKWISVSQNYYRSLRHINPTIFIFLSSVTSDFLLSSSSYVLVFSSIKVLVNFPIDNYLKSNWFERPKEILTLADGERAKKSREAASLECQEREKPAEKIEDPLISDIAIVAGETIIDRKSTFQPFYAKVNTVADALRFREKLLQNRKIASATHNMVV